MYKLGIKEPMPYCVYQRGSDGNAIIPIAGDMIPGAESLTATFEPVNGGTTVVQTIAVDKGGNFGGIAVVPGGWYRLKVTGPDGLVMTVERVGSGEVFVGFGHSFISGNHDKSRQLPAQDERVITLNGKLDSTEFSFGKLTERVGPMGDGADFWGQLGDKLVARLGVPVLFFNAAYGGSNIKQNYELLNGLERTSLPPGINNVNSRQPFLPLEFVMDNFITKTGIRGLIVEHGYNDRGTDRNTFIERFKNVFDYIRTRWQKPNLPIILVQEQLTNVPGTLADPETAQGLKILIDSYSDTTKGPDFNAPQWANLFATNDHLFGMAIDQFATDWANSLGSEFFENSVPYTGTLFPDVFPLVLYNAPTTVKPLDYVILTVLGIVLVALIVKRSKSLMWAFFLLALLAWSRGIGKV